MTQTLFLAVPLALLMAGSLAAAPLQLPPGAVQIGARNDAPARYAMPIAAFDGTSIPTRLVTGRLDQRAWRLDGNKANSLALLQPLADQLTAQGYTVLFTCETTVCGGFDFRFGLDVLPEPQMHVDLGDFQYLAAVNPDGDAVSLMVSRTADQGFIQITSVSPTGMPAVQPQPAAAPPPLPAAPTAEPPEAAPPETASLAQQLMTSGSVALDDLIFASGNAALQDQDYTSLQALADWLKANPTLKVTLVGHTDATGALAANTALSRQRAVAVRDWLIQRYKAVPGQIDAQGAGYLAPRATNQTPEGRTINRRVEVMLTSTPLK
ncbi:MAG: OmpA family protein [Pseudorhodobacter sp.]|nr:OmpA family protein [Pseudorhodobacter sp.]